MHFRVRFRSLLKDRGASGINRPGFLSAFQLDILLDHIGPILFLECIGPTFLP